MLDVLRRNAGSWAIKIILGLIAVTFVSWGVGTYSDRAKDVVATVGKTEITKTELEEAAAGLEKTYRDVYGATFTPEMARALKLREQAMSSLLQRTILLKEADDLGLTASVAEVQREISATPAFQVNDRFSEERYRNILAYNRISPPEFESSKRREITLRKMEGLLSAGSRATEAEAREYFDAYSRKVRVVVVAADPEKAPAPAVADGDIALFYDRTKESLRTPARVRLLVARFDPAAFASAGPEPSDDKVRAFYEENGDKFRTDEERLLSRILVPRVGKDNDAARAKADEVLAEANRGRGAFDNAARKYPKGRSPAAWTRRSQLPSEQAGAVFSAPVDAAVGPFGTPQGYLVVRVDQIRFPETLPLPKVRDRVVAALRQSEGKDLAVIKAYEAQREAAAKGDLKSACAPHRIEAVSTGWLEGKGDASAPPAVVQDALVLRKGEVGPVKSIGDVHYLFQVLDKEESRIPALAEVKDRIRAALLREKRREAARAKLLSVLGASNTAGELERNAKAAGFSATTTPFFAPLSGSVPETLGKAEDLARDLATLSPKTRVVQKAFERGDRFIGVGFVDERRPDAKEWETKREEFMKQMVEQKKARLIEAYLSDRKRQFKIKIDTDALK